MEPNRVILARSRREVMDWGLVLASQEIETAIVRLEEGWGLLVPEGDYDRAQATLQLYREENRGWRWKQRLPVSGIVFHWGAVVWVAAMVAFYYWTMELFPQLQAAGLMDNQRVREGQWWRIFTAITLHENLPHLAANTVSGGLLLGLAMARYGPGVAMLAAFLAGAAGNCADLVFRPSDGLSLGASGMVMGALGLLSVYSLAILRKYPGAHGTVLRGAVAGFLLLVLTGFAPGSDMVAHVGGFLSGTVIGVGLNAVRSTTLQRGGPNVVAATILAGWITLAWQQALPR